MFTPFSPRLSGMSDQFKPPSRDTRVVSAEKYVMRFDGNGFSGICAWRIIDPDFVASTEGCKPRGRTMRSSPHSTRNLPSDSSNSGLFGVVSSVAIADALSDAVPLREAVNRKTVKSSVVNDVLNIPLK